MNEAWFNQKYDEWSRSPMTCGFADFLGWTDQEFINYTERGEWPHELTDQQRLNAAAGMFKRAEDEIMKALGL